jgi:hypothetical protein
MNTELSVAVYIRGNTAYVVPHAGTGGLRIEIEPVVAVPAEKDHLATALEEASRRASNLSGTPNLRNYKSPVLAAAGVASLSKFEQGAQYFTVKRSHQGVKIQRFRHGPGKKGFEADGEPLQLPAGVPMAAAAEEILKPT